MRVVQVASVAAGAALGFWWARGQRGLAKGKTDPDFGLASRENRLTLRS